MDILFTPWRYPYLTAPKNESQSCIFCNAVNSDALRDTLTIFRTDDALVMLNRYPYTNGHLMVAPVAHEALLFQAATIRSNRSFGSPRNRNASSPTFTIRTASTSG